MDDNYNFIPPAMLHKYPNKEYRFVGYGLKEGDEVYVELDREGKQQKKTISQIIEERPSLGSFPNTNRPTSYRIAVL